MLKQRVAGKSLPLEKFCTAKAERYLQRGSLILPQYELLYLWSGFVILERDMRLLKPIYAEVLTALEESDGESDAVYGKNTLLQTPTNARCVFCSVLCVCAVCKRPSRQSSA